MNEAGFWIQENVFSDSECDDLLQVLSSLALERSRAGVRNLMAQPAIQKLASDHRLLQIAACAFGQPLIPYKATLFDKSDQANWLVAWHQDTILPLEQKVAAWGPWSKKAGIDYAQAPSWALARILALRIHLDASRSANGPLRVIPGSHLAGIMTDEAVAAVVKSSHPTDCLVGRGGVLAMSPLLVHSSSKVQGVQPRRVLHFEYAPGLEIIAGIRLKVA
jgi:ectoine hydroxylase-related dioxygenase (phytanoyl-CoA dioxygenase family)